MLREAERRAKKVLTLNPEKEEFWDGSSSLYPLLTEVEARPQSIREEIEELIDQLPED